MANEPDKEFILMTEALNQRFIEASHLMSKNVYFYDMIVTEKINSLKAHFYSKTESIFSQLPKLYSDLQKQRKKMLNHKTQFIEAGNNFYLERELFLSNSLEGSKKKYKEAKSEKNIKRTEYINSYVILKRNYTPRCGKMWQTAFKKRLSNITIN